MQKTSALNPRKKILLDLAERKSFPAAEFHCTTKYFGENTFNEQNMRERLPKETYEKLLATIKKGEKLDMNIANTVAHAMKEWALSKGVSHYTHWFQPQTGLTAEKHDAFLEIDNGIPVERFRGNQLVQGEPDASSFPSGGSRTTFEARGYTMWDPSSPAFIVEGPRGGILCIPSVFISYTGEALDKKTPLLRSMGAINRAALRLLHLFGNTTATRVVTTIGTEQEYFLIDKAFYNLRPDLQHTGRTLIGAHPPNGQQLDDHYFGAIKERVLAFMQDAERELYKLGVPAKTRHNEVAPHQFEIVPIYGEANVAADRNQLTMELLKKIGNRYGLAVLLHEKPFTKVNGSGKHNNWSMEDSDGNNLLDPGDTPEQNVQFLVFLVAILRAVHNYGDLLRMSIASAGNDHRLGANEAPPAIISVFLGERLNKILDAIKEGQAAAATDEQIIDLGLANLPSILRDHTDRNRTSPFAFTGQKFEFRAVGSSASVSLPNTILNAAVAESISLLADEIEGALQRGAELKDAALQILQKYIRETEPVRFEGNNYSDDWAREAERRNLPNIKRTAAALRAFVEKKNMHMLIRQGVFTEHEIIARYNTKLEQYITSLQIEADTFCNLIETRVLPAAIDYQEQLLNVVSLMQAVQSSLADAALNHEKALLGQINSSIAELITGCGAIRHAVEKAEAIEALPEKAEQLSDTIVDLLAKVRGPADALECLVPDDLWPLPKYSEMLYVI
ncbi:glutamine synthetase III [candidate division KSB1 bacterium]|nr:glutamine synthetase III [candidate division KSB1 bacterium]RQW06779.1 MAG: glutamine synthetase type III [candidate division KSB1 bacterium]